MRKKEFEEYKNRCEEVINFYPERNQALLPLLHLAQQKFGYIPKEIALYLAEKLQLPKAKVWSTVTFYSMFSLKKQGRYVIRVCNSLSCYLKGAKTIIEVIKEELGIKENQTTKDKKFTLEVTSCLGLCDISPAMMINEKVYGNLTPQKVRKILSKYKKE